MRRRLHVMLIGMLVPLSACGWTATDLPLPGGGLTGETYQLNAEFTDVLNLPQKARVTLDGVEIGQVEAISAKGYTATVTLNILDTFELPRGTSLQLRQATALGEVFIAVNPPAHSAEAMLKEGDTIPVEQTGAAPSIEDTLAALSTLLNGGGLSNIMTIVEELNVALDGRVAPTKHLLGELASTAATLHSRSQDIHRILVSMDRLTRRVVADEQVIDEVMAATRPAIGELRSQTKQFIDMLARFDALAMDGQRLVLAVRTNAVHLFDRLGPVLDGFVALDGKLGPTLDQMMVVYETLKKLTRGSGAAASLDLVGATNDVNLPSRTKVGGRP